MTCTIFNVKKWASWIKMMTTGEPERDVQWTGLFKMSVAREVCVGLHHSNCFLYLHNVGWTEVNGWNCNSDSSGSPINCFSDALLPRHFKRASSLFFSNATILHKALSLFLMMHWRCRASQMLTNWKARPETDDLALKAKCTRTVLLWWEQMLIRWTSTNGVFVFWPLW